MVSLCLLGDNGVPVERWKIEANPLAVGRGESAYIVVADATLSRRHFVIFREGKEYLLKDLESQNGTWVDGQRAQLATLRHHTCILAGRTLFMFSERSAELADKANHLPNNPVPPSPS